MIVSGKKGGVGKRCQTLFHVITIHLGGVCCWCRQAVWVENVVHGSQHRGCVQAAACRGTKRSVCSGIHLSSQQSCQFVVVLWDICHFILHRPLAPPHTADDDQQ